MVPLGNRRAVRRHQPDACLPDGARPRRHRWTGCVGIIGDEAHVTDQLRRIADAGATEFVGTLLGDTATQHRTVELLLAHNAQNVEIAG
jgi:hypothetical protein